METLRNSWWLAGREMRRTWLSYLVTAILMALFGLWTTSLEASGPSAGPGDLYILDLYFIFITSILATNGFSRDYFSSWGDSFSKRLHFWRSLPISARVVVASRVLSMLPALALNSLAFFLTIYLISEPLGRWLAEQLGPVRYLWFTLIWVGYSLFWGGCFLYLEYGIHGRTYNWFVLGGVAIVPALLVPLELLFDLRIVMRTIELVGAYGPLPAAAALLIGVAAFVLWAGAAVRRIERRDLSA